MNPRTSTITAFNYRIVIATLLSLRQIWNLAAMQHFTGDSGRQGTQSVVMSVLHTFTCARATVPCQSTRLPTVQGPRKRAMIQHAMEHSHYSNSPDFVSQLWLGMRWPNMNAPWEYKDKSTTLEPIWCYRDAGQCIHEIFHQIRGLKIRFKD